MTTTANTPHDLLTRFMLGAGQVRGQVVRLEQGWQAIAKLHEQALGLHHLGELTVAGNLLAASLKFEGSLVLQIHGDGPIKLMVVECRELGLFRATIKASAQANPSEALKLSELVNAQGRGRFVVTLDPGAGATLRQPYQGVVPFEGESVAQVLENYMSRSEQIPSRLFIAANDRIAAGLLLQKMPELGGTNPTPSTPNPDLLAYDPDLWPRVQQLAQTLSSDELLSLAPQELLHRLFWQEDLQTLDDRPVRFSCSCSRAKVASMLKMLGRDEVESILAEQGSITTNCEFCNTQYAFDAVDAAAALLEGVLPVSKQDSPKPE